MDIRLIPKKWFIEWPIEVNKFSKVTHSME